MAAGTRPSATTLPFTFRVTSIGPPIFPASFESTSIFTLPVGSLSLDLSLVPDLEEVELVAKVAVFHIAGDTSREASERIRRC